MSKAVNPASGCTVEGLVSLSDCLDEINNALNYWYPVRSDNEPDEWVARHVRLFNFRDRLENQIKTNAGSHRQEEAGS